MVAIAFRVMMVKACSSKLKVAEEEVDVKGEVEVGGMVEGRGTVEGGVVVKGEVKAEITLVAVAVMVGKGNTGTDGYTYHSIFHRKSWLHS